jgi:hypothetical protein
MDRGTVGLDAQYEPWQMQCDSVMRTKSYKKKNFISLILAGHEHNEKFWSTRFGHAAMFLLGPCKKNYK